ncbi:MAG: DUF2807 domain-containing protein [Sphingobacteriaceae bacterium]|nr:DUF2807 domain-containing protein [Cytophagaceae bacterium]
MPRFSALLLLFFLPVFGFGQTAQTSPVNAFLTATIVTLGLVTLALVALAPDGTATPASRTEQELNFSEFDSIDIHNGVRMLVTQGPVFRVAVKGTPAGINRLAVQQTGRTLRAYHRFGFWFRFREVTLLVTVPELRAVEASGACLVQISGFENGRALDLEATGATVIKFSGQAERLRAEATGASRINLTGQCEHLDAKVVGASSFDAFELQAQTAHVECVGASNAHVLVARELSAEAVGASSIRYQGNPALRADSVGASSITHV